MHKNLNKFLARLSYTKLNEDGSVAKLFKGDLDNLTIDKESLDKYQTSKGVIDVPNTYQMWELLRSENMFDEEIVDLFDLYINFLKTPLTLGMFIAVDEEGKFVDEPAEYSRFLTISKDNFNAWNLKTLGECIAYKEAQERIIFHGWRLLSVKGSVEKRSIILIDDRGCGLNFLENNVWQNLVRMRTVGDLGGQIRLFAVIKKV